MLELFINSMFWFCLAMVFAAIEIEAEGKFGWAEKMPTWYRTSGFFAKVYGIVMAKKPLTGYHTFMFFLPLMIFHSHFFVGIEWSKEKELLSLSLYFAFCPCWDFLWFILNPHYTLENFSKEKVWWHAKSYWLFGKLPLDYVIGWAVSVALGAMAGYLDENNWAIQDSLYRLAFFTLFTLATIFTAPLYHQWYTDMRKKDDRDKTLPQ